MGAINQQTSLGGHYRLCFASDILDGCQDKSVSGDVMGEMADWLSEASYKCRMGPPGDGKILPIDKYFSRWLKPPTSNKLWLVLQLSQMIYLLDLRKGAM